MGARRDRIALILAVALGIVACGTPDGGSPTGSGLSPGAPVIVTFELNEGDRFRVLLTERADIDAARNLLAGVDGPDIPNGRIARETGVNEGWSWSLDPSDFEFADVTIEVCDGTPDDVESGELTSERYCPWSARVVAVEPAP